MEGVVSIYDFLCYGNHVSFFRWDCHKHWELTLGATPMEDQHYLYLGLALVALFLIMLAKRRRSAIACV